MLSGVTVGGDGAAHLSEDLSLGNEAAANEGNIPATGCPASAAHTNISRIHQHVEVRRELLSLKDVRHRPG